MSTGKRSSRIPASSVGSRPLDAVDHQDVDGTSGRLQLEPELFLHGREDRGAVWIDRRKWWSTGWRATLRQLVRRPGEIDIETPREPGAIDNNPLHELGQES